MAEEKSRKVKRKKQIQGWEACKLEVRKHGRRRKKCLWWGDHGRGKRYVEREGMTWKQWQMEEDTREGMHMTSQ